MADRPESRRNRRREIHHLGTRRPENRPREIHRLESRLRGTHLRETRRPEIPREIHRLEIHRPKESQEAERAPIQLAPTLSQRQPLIRYPGDRPGHESELR